MVEYPPRTPLFPQGLLTDTVFLITSGLVKLTHVDSDGKEIIVGVRPSGWLLGVTALILNQPQLTGVVTLTHCQLMRISGAEIRDSMRAGFTFCRYLNELLALDVHDHLLNIVELTSHSTEYRLAKLLAQLIFGVHSSQPTAGRNVQLPFKQWEIAELLAVTPEHTCRVLRRLEQEGLVLRRGKLLFVPEPERLLSFSR